MLQCIIMSNYICDAHTHFQDLYQLNLNHDPEGILGSLNSIVLCFMGVQAGKTLLHYRGKHLSILVRFTVWGMALVREHEETPLALRSKVVEYRYPSLS